MQTIQRIVSNSIWNWIDNSSSSGRSSIEVSPNFCNDQHHSDPWRLSIDLRSPESGLDVYTSDGRRTSLFPIAFTGSAYPYLHECYVRNADLIALYPQRSNRPFTLQLDYRVLPIEDSHNAARPDKVTALRPDRCVQIELWISIQTYLLDTHPSVAMDIHLQPTSAPPSRHAIAILSGACPPSGLHVTYMVDPHDQQDTKWEHHDVHHSAKFFGHFMEKGVIRRARMRCLVSDQAISSEFIAQQYNDFVDSPLPLTA